MKQRSRLLSATRIPESRHMCTCLDKFICVFTETVKNALRALASL